MHPMDVFLLCLAGYGLRNLGGQETSSALRKTGSVLSRGEPWRKTQMLFPFEEQRRKQLSDSSCLLSGRDRAGICQVFPAITAGLLEPRDTSGLKMQLYLCFETCLGLWPSTSIFHSNFLSWKKSWSSQSSQHSKQVGETSPLLRCPCCGY